MPTWAKKSVRTASRGRLIVRCFSTCIAITSAAFELGLADCLRPQQLPHAAAENQGLLACVHSPWWPGPTPRLDYTLYCAESKFKKVW